MPPIELNDPETSQIHRRSFLTRAATLGLGATAAAFLPGIPVRAHAATSTADNLSGDTVTEIFTAALIAEDLATTFYLNALIGEVITDPNLAGPGGTALNVGPGGNLGNVQYFRAALSQEIAHANLLRTLLGQTDYHTDPVQTFYVNYLAFREIGAFTATLDALESAFIGAYLCATIEFAQMAVDTKAGIATYKDSKGDVYSPRELEYFSQVAASIMGVEAQHRVLGRVTSNTNPANNFNYQQLDGLTAVYNGSTSAAAALTPFFAGPGTNLAKLSFIGAINIANEMGLGIPSTDGPPAPPTYPS